MHPESRAGSGIIEETTTFSASEDELVARAEESREPFSPEVVLFVDDSEEIIQARELLVAAGAEYRTIAAHGPRIPAIVFGGIVADGLAGVRDLLCALDAFSSAFVHQRVEGNGVRDERASHQAATPPLAGHVP